MRSLIAGADSAGRSCIVDELKIEDRDIHAPGPSFRTDVYQLRQSPPPMRGQTRGGYHETGLEPGHLDICQLQMPAGIEHPNHYTDTLNLHVVVAGSVEVLLDDGAHLLE